MPCSASRSATMGLVMLHSLAALSMLSAKNGIDEAS